MRAEVGGELYLNVPPLCLINNLTFTFLYCNSSVAVLLLKDQIFLVDITKILLIVQFNSLCSSK